jgi:hypothetical protein
MEKLPDVVVPFKRDTYERIVEAFAKFAAPAKPKAVKRPRTVKRAKPKSKNPKRKK